MSKNECSIPVCSPCFHWMIIVQKLDKICRFCLSCTLVWKDFGVSLNFLIEFQSVAGWRLLMWVLLKSINIIEL